MTYKIKKIRQFVSIYIKCFFLIFVLSVIINKLSCLNEEWYSKLFIFKILLISLLNTFLILHYKKKTTHKFIYSKR